MREVDPGDPVVPLTTFQAGTVMATVADMSDLIFNGTVDEIDVGKLKVGVPARLNIGALPGELVTGYLSRIAPQAKEEEGARLFEVEIELHEVEEPGNRLTSGLFVDCRSDHPGEDRCSDCSPRGWCCSKRTAPRPLSSCRHRLHRKASPRRSRSSDRSLRWLEHRSDLRYLKRR